MAHDDPDQGPDLDPSRENPDDPADPVRRLLAEARHDQPLPPEVAARLDTLLGELVEARSAESGVSSLSARRRQRRRLLLVAAAAAVVVGIAIPTINRAGTSSDDAGSSAADSSASQTQPEAAAPPAPAPEDAAGDSASQAPSPLATGQEAPAAKAVPTVTLTSTDFEADVRRALQGARPAEDASTYALSRSADACPAPAAAYPLLYPATYDGQPAVLGASLPSSGAQTVDLYLCGQSEPVRSVTVDLAR